MATEHRRRTDTNGVELHERATDRDFWTKLGVWANHYKVAWLFWTVVVSAGGWMTKTYLDPLKAIPTVQMQQVVILARLDTAEGDRKDIYQVLKVFGKVICAGMSAPDRYKYDINCRDLPAVELSTPRVDLP